MSKRKWDRHNEHPTDYGIGATLAHLRAEAQPDNATATIVGDEEEDGWTVVRGTKRSRREERNHNQELHRSNSQSPTHNAKFSRSATSSPNADQPKDKQRSSSSQDRPFDHLISERDEQRETGRSHLENPIKQSSQGGLANPGRSRDDREKIRKHEKNYPAIEHSHHARLSSHVKITDLQSLVLYLLADGNAPQWASVRSRSGILQVVTLMVPGLELGMFNGDITLDSPGAEESNTGSADKRTAQHGAKNKRLNLSPDDFYPASLRPDRLPAALKPLSDIFTHVWPVKAPGEHRANQYTRVHSPIHTMLISQLPKSHEEKQMKKSTNHKGPAPQTSDHWENKRTRITEYIANLVEQQENDYALHPAMFTTEESKEAACERRELAKQTSAYGWMDTLVTTLEDADVPESVVEQGSVTAGRHVLSIDCEMCKAVNDELVLTRVSIVNWDGSVALDKLVKPDVAIKDYLTQWSGITAAMLENVTTTLADIQAMLLELITARTILVGHSLNSDLNALKITHPFLVDTGLLYPHPRGPPYKQSLKYLAQKYLKRQVQKGHEGHDSVEDARTCLDLVKQKCERGPRWGSGDTNTESIFKRLGRSTRPRSKAEFRTGAVIDWGEPNRGYGGQAQLSIGCTTDTEVVEAIERAVTGQAVGKEGIAEKNDFVWARLRELELARGWWDDAKTADVESIRKRALHRLGLQTEVDATTPTNVPTLNDIVSGTIENIKRIFDTLPRGTAFIVYSGTGDPREIRRYQAMQQQFRREYATKNWDNISVKWTDTEIQALSQACQVARNGIGLITVK